MALEEPIVMSRNEFEELQALNDLLRVKLAKYSTQDKKKKKPGLTDAQRARLLLQKNKSL